MATNPLISQLINNPGPQTYPYAPFPGQLPQRFQLPEGGPYSKYSTATVVDPKTGFPLDLSLLREGQATGEATVAHGFALESEAEQRRKDALASLDPLQAQIDTQLKSNGYGEDWARLLFAKGADEASSGARAAMAQAGSALGARGISPNSGTALGIAQNIDLARTGQVAGTERDVRTAAIQSAATTRAQALSAALGLGNLQANLQSYVPTQGTDAMNGLTSLIIQRQALRQAEKNGKKAGQNSLISGLLSGGLQAAAGAAGLGAL